MVEGYEFQLLLPLLDLNKDIGWLEAMPWRLRELLGSRSGLSWAELGFLCFQRMDGGV